MAEQNEVVRKGSVVIKRFASHLNYLKESSIYDKLRGSGLAPRLLFEGDDSIEHEFAEGPSLLDMLTERSGDPAELAKCFKLFFDWYQAFRAKTGTSLGRVDFSKFIYTDSGVVCIDFEHCRAGYMEWDIAYLAAGICLVPEPYSFRAIEICRLFISVGAGILTWDPDRLSQCLKAELDRQRTEKGIAADDEAERYLISALSCCGILFAEDPLVDVTAAMPFLSTAPQRIIVCPEEGKPACPSFTCFAAGYGKVTSLYTASRLMKEVRQPWSLWLSAYEKYTRESIIGLLAAEKEDLDVLIASSESSGRIFPMLIRTETAQIALGMAVSSGINSLPEALKRMRVAYI
ncbi:MAG: hypothetical protein II499_03775 [Firmicutes bacterium]|nr:hypothetical protein [Bacillota bacterium]MBQ1524768.1 hypothetical protein [Bacillota bacterium]MBQ1888846.1 hypothetical protein [Bacillota bacterium]MBQ2455190.1 hypothetical protein [Bacillota bacterium]MBQ4181252.1 hypothetical protein [Bacillota bacterium]